MPANEHFSEKRIIGSSSPTPGAAVNKYQHRREWGAGWKDLDAFDRSRPVAVDRRLAESLPHLFAGGGVLGENMLHIGGPRPLIVGAVQALLIVIEKYLCHKISTVLKIAWLSSFC